VVNDRVFQRVSSLRTLIGRVIRPVELDGEVRTPVRVLGTDDEVEMRFQGIGVLIASESAAIDVDDVGEPWLDEDSDAELRGNVAKYGVRLGFTDVDEKGFPPVADRGQEEGK
jgi:hypothetical protein